MDCRVIHLKYVECLWKNPDINYTFYSRFYGGSYRECDTYIIKDGLNAGCRQIEDNLKTKRFLTFETILEHEQKNHTEELQLKNKVKLDPPSNLTVQFRSEELLFEWKQIFAHCVENEVRYRVNENRWEPSYKMKERNQYNIPLPSNSSRYELQVRSRVSDSCGQSEEWSDWSQPVVWGTHNNTAPAVSRASVDDSLNVWSVVIYCVVGVALFLLIVMVLRHDRIRIILIPVVPKPSLAPHDLQEWLDSSKGLKEAFKTNYMEHACSVHEYCPIPSSDSNSSDSSNISVSTDQTNCSGPIPYPDLNNPRPCSTAELAPSEEQHISV